MAVARNVNMSQVGNVGIHVNSGTATTAFTLTRDDSGVTFINKDTAATTYTLPSTADGKGCVFYFWNDQTTAAITITSPTADTLIIQDSAYTSATSAAERGIWAKVIGDGTYYYFFDPRGAGTASCWTVA